MCLPSLEVFTSEGGHKGRPYILKTDDSTGSGTGFETRPYVGMIVTLAMKKIFIANRGEIACRIARTAHRLGIRTCGVFTPQDEHTRHVRFLQEVVRLPAGDLSANYLNADLLLARAKEFGADAVHPGYGFLAENPEFAEKVMRAGMTWIGPPPAAMRELGGKIEAKEAAKRAGVPVTPWMRLSDDPDDAETTRILGEIGLPALIKAAHGGGGRGQRVVREPSQFAEALRAARSEARRSFGSDAVFIERFLDCPRHIEVQILADHHGHTYALGERDCTLQRRNQKVIEEAPAVLLDAATRARIHDAAVKLASTVGYTNAGTIEFLAQQRDDGVWEYFFMELNARLQVEHPVTEEIWKIDLVELQIRAAGGEDLSRAMASAGPPAGHAIELRLCAEDPSNQFLPTPGPVTDLSWPDAEGLRVETGFEPGDTVPQEYDSLLAKLIVHGSSRDDCVQRLLAVLDQILLAGLITNRTFLRSLLSHPDFAANRIYTRWIDAHPELAQSSDALDGDLRYWGKKFSSELFVQRKPFPQLESFSDSVRSGPVRLTGFDPEPEMHGSYSPQGLVRIRGAFSTESKGRVDAAGWINRFELCLSFAPLVDGIGQRKLAFAGQFESEDAHMHHHGPVVSQVPGLVLDVRAREGEAVGAHQPVLVLEAMKIEMPVSLPVEARITMIHVKAGDRILPGQTLVSWEPV